MKIELLSIARCRGRPRQFDRNEALNIAVRLFWEHGYEATSIHKLACAMGIRPASLYAAFNDKADLFREALGRYQASVSFVENCLKLTPTKKAISSLLLEAANHFTDQETPSGCLIVLSGISFDRQSSPEIEKILTEKRAGFEKLLFNRLERGLSEGDLDVNTDLHALARYLVMIFQGLAVAAREGKTKLELEQSAVLALRGWSGVN